MDSAYYASLGRSIAEGDYLLQVNHMSDKPPLFFYVQALFFQLLGVSASVAVLPSFVGGMMGIGIIYFLGRDLKNSAAGLLAAFLFAIIAPIGGIVFGMVLVGIIIAVFAKRRPAVVNRTFGRLSIISSAWLALTHGANDGQKTMGIIVLILFSADLISEIHMPLWVILAAASAMGLGTFFGGYKVIKTLGLKITRLKPYQEIGRASCRERV